MTAKGSARKLRAVFLSGLLIFSLLAIAPVGGVGSTAANQPYDAVVNGDGNGDYETIQAAVNGATSGDSILVEDGTYEEEVIVDVEDLELVAAEGANPVLAGGGQRAIAIHVVAPTVSIDGVEVRDYDLSNESNVGAIQIDTSSVEVSNATITGTVDGFGVNANGTGFHLADSAITDNYDGVFVGEDGTSIRSSDVSANERRGIVLRSNSGTTIEDSTVSDNGESGVYQATEGTGSRAATDVTVTGSTLEGNGETAIYLHDGARADVTDNALSQNSGGIYVDNGSTVLDNLLSDNTADGSTSGGVRVGPNSVVAENTITGVTGAGVRADGGGTSISDNEVLESSTFGFNDGMGIRVFDDTNTVVNNTVRSNEEAGIEVRGSTLVSGNRLENNGDGVVSDGAGTLNATHNWWGDETGPSGDVEDPETGAIADGDGDAIAGSSAENVRFDPWIASDPAEAPAPASFEVSDLSPAQTDVAPGETSDVSALVENTGDEGATKTVEVRLDGTTEATESVQLDAGENTRVTFEDVAMPEDPGSYAHSVWTADDEVSGTITVSEPEPATASLYDLSSPPDAVEPGDAFTVSVTVENVGDQSGTKTVELRVDGEEQSTQTVDLDAGESTTVTFEDVAAPEATGQYLVKFWTADDDANTVLTVEEPAPATFEVSDLSPPLASVTTDETLDVSGVVENTGDESGTKTVELRFDGEAQGTQSVGLDPGESTTVTYTDVSVPDEPGSYEYSVWTDDHNETGILAVVGADELTEFEAAVAEDEVVWGETYTVAISNATTASGDPFDGVADVNVSLPGAGDSVAVESVAFDGGEATIAAHDATDFAWDDVVPGEYSDQGVVHERASGMLVIDTFAVDVLEPVSTVEVAALDPEATDLTTDETVDVSAVVENVGNAAATTDVEVQFDGEVQDTQSVDLDPGESTTVTFADVETPGEPGEYTLSVATEDDEAAGTLTVEAHDDVVSFEATVVGEEVVPGDGYPVAMSSVTDGSGEPYDGVVNVEATIPGNDETVTVEDVEVTDGEATVRLDTADGFSWLDVEPGRYPADAEDQAAVQSVRYERIDGQVVDDTYDVTIVEPPIDSFEAEAVEDEVMRGETYTVAISNATTASGDPFDGVVDIGVSVPGAGDTVTVQDVAFDDGEATIRVHDAAEFDWDDVKTGEYSTQGVLYEQAGGLTVSDTIEVDVVDPVSTFEVAELDPETAEVTTDETADVSVVVENTGNVAGATDVELRIDDVEQSTRTVTLDAGESTTVTFENVGTPEGAGEYTHSVWTEDDEASGTLTVELSGEDVSSFDVAVQDSPLEPGDELVLEFTNATTVAGDTFDGDIENSMFIDYPSGITYSTTFIDFENGTATTAVPEEYLWGIEHWDGPVELGEYSPEIRYDRNDGSTFSTTYDIELVGTDTRDDLGSVDVTLQNGPLEPGDEIVLEFTNATTVAGDVYDGDIENSMFIDYPGGGSYSTTFVEFENGTATTDIPAENMWENYYYDGPLDLGEYSPQISYDRNDGSTFSTTYNIELGEDVSTQATTESTDGSTDAGGPGFTAAATIVALLVTIQLRRRQ